MNFLSQIVSIFILNMMIHTIISYLPLRSKMFWKILIISILNSIDLLFNFIILFTYKNFEIIFLINVLGNCLAVVVGYIASMAIVLDGIILFKSKRLKQFERDLNNKNHLSIPRNIIALIFCLASMMLLIYAIVTFLNYSNDLLIVLIGTLLVLAIFIILTIYFFISSLPSKNKLKGNTLLFIIKTKDDYLLFSGSIKGENPLENIESDYFIDELGMIVTPNIKYIVKGIKVENVHTDLLSRIKLSEEDNKLLKQHLNNFQKYNCKKIILDANYNLIKVKNIK